MNSIVVLTLDIFLLGLELVVDDGEFADKMESDLGKLFIGGISWDTDEDRLKDYFSNYGEVVEAMIMRDRVTGRARGFGFVVFSDPAVAERVIMDKHMIDGRTVRALMIIIL